MILFTGNVWKNFLKQKETGNIRDKDADGKRVHIIYGEKAEGLYFLCSSTQTLLFEEPKTYEVKRDFFEAHKQIIGRDFCADKLEKILLIYNNHENIRVRECPVESYCGDELIYSLPDDISIVTDYLKKEEEPLIITRPHLCDYVSELTAKLGHSPRTVDFSKYK